MFILLLVEPNRAYAKCTSWPARVLHGSGKILWTHILCSRRESLPDESNLEQQPWIQIYLLILQCITHHQYHILCQNWCCTRCFCSNRSHRSHPNLLLHVRLGHLLIQVLDWHHQALAAATRGWKSSSPPWKIWRYPACWSIRFLAKLQFGSEDVWSATNLIP